MKNRPRRIAVKPLASGAVEIIEDDGVVIAGSEIKHQRILAALRKGGRLFVHINPRKP